MSHDTGKGRKACQSDLGGTYLLTPSGLQQLTDQKTFKSKKTWGFGPC